MVFSGTAGSLPMPFPGLRLPAPPPGLGSGAVKAIGGGLKGLGGAVAGLGSSAVSAVVFDGLFPQSTAKSALSELPEGFFDSGLEETVEPRIEGDPPFTGGQGIGVAYKYRVRYDTYAGENPWITGKLSNEKINTGPISGIIIEGEGTSAIIKVGYLAIGGYEAFEQIDSGAYGGITFRNASFEYLIRADNTSQEDDVNENGNPPPTIINEGSTTRTGIVNPPSNYEPPEAPWSGYTGPRPGTFTGHTPITLPPSVSNGDLGDGGIGADVVGGGGTSGLEGGGTSISGGTGAGSVAGSGSIGSGGGGIVGGGVITGTGGTTTGGTISTGGTATGTGLETGTGSSTGIGTGTGTGTGTGELIGDIPIIDGNTGETVDTLAPGETTVLEPGVLPFPGEGTITDSPPRTIDKPKPLVGSGGATLDPPTEQEEEKKPQPIIPIPFDLDGDGCCEAVLQAVNDLANDLECVIENICGEKDPIVWEFLRVDVFTDPEPAKVFNPSTQGLGEDVVISGYLRWVVQGLPVGEEIPIRRRQQVFLVPDWSDGYDLYNCHGSQLVGTIIYSGSEATL